MIRHPALHWIPTGLALAAAGCVLTGLGIAAGCNRIDTERTPEVAREEPARPVPPADAPDVVLVTIDTLRADHVGAYGAGPGRTPTLDAIAEEGVLFDTAIAPTPITLPSHASILTGMTPPEHSVRHNGLFRLPDEVETLAERFRSSGYETGAIVAAVVLARTFGLDQGFDHYDDHVGSRRAAVASYQERTAAEVTSAALAWLEERQGPFFLWLHYYDPHAVYQPPAPFSERFADDPYSGEIAYVDAELGRVVEALRARPRWDRTLLVVTADHAESLGEHHETTHSYTLYDAALHVPWLLRGPGLPAGARVPGVVSTVDVAPTLLSLAGLPPLAAAGGVDLSARAARSAPAGSVRAVYAETLATKLDHGWAPLFAARTDRHLYVRAPRPELYDLESDPDQLHNLLADDEASAAPAADAAAAATVAVLDGFVGDALAEEREGSDVALDAETRAQIQALGYAIPDAPVTETGVDPKDALQWVTPFEYAKARYGEGHLDEAALLAKQLRDQMPESPMLTNLLTLIYLSMNQPDDALHFAQRGVDLMPDSSRSHVLLGLAKVVAQDIEGAVASFERAVELDPQNAEAHAGLMWRARHGGSMVDAAEHARQAVALDPQNADIRRLVADVWDQLGRYDLALERYREAVELDPENAQAHLGIAVQLARMGDLDAMERHLERSGPTGASLPAKMRMAIALAGRGETGKAERILRAILDVHPDFAGARRVLALLLERTGRPDEAAVLREQDAAAVLREEEAAAAAGTASPTGRPAASGPPTSGRPVGPAARDAGKETL